MNFKRGQHNSAQNIGLLSFFLLDTGFHCVVQVDFELTVTQVGFELAEILLCPYLKTFKTVTERRKKNINS